MCTASTSTPEWRPTGSGIACCPTSARPRAATCWTWAAAAATTSGAWWVKGRNWRSVSTPSPPVPLPVRGHSPLRRTTTSAPTCCRSVSRSCRRCGRLTPVFHGVLYHRKSPSSNIEQLRNQLKDDGELGAGDPGGRRRREPGADACRSLTGKMRNVWFLLERRLTALVERCGFTEVRIVDENMTSTRRTASYSTG